MKAATTRFAHRKLHVCHHARDLKVHRWRLAASIPTPGLTSRKPSPNMAT